MLDLDDIKKLADAAYNASYDNAVAAADDRVFTYITHYTDDLLKSTTLRAKLSFDIVRKGVRDVVAKLEENPIQVDFEPQNSDDSDIVDIVDMLYRNDDNDNRSIEAYEVAKTDTVVCGQGAWKLSTEYESMNTGDKKQVIKRTPIHEASNCVFYDPAAKLVDKSDGKYALYIESYSEHGYKEYVKKLTGSEPEDSNPSSFMSPVESLTFPWFTKDKCINIAEFYHKETVNDSLITFQDQYEQNLLLFKGDIEDGIDELIEAGYEVIDEKKIERDRVRLYIVSGKEIIWNGLIVGPNIPIVPVLGEYAYIEGVLHSEGLIRLAKDPQRLRDFVLSYLADITAKSPRSKPVYYPEQIAGYEHMYDQNGPENDYPYLIQNQHDKNGQPLPGGPVGMTPDPQIPAPLAALADISKVAVEDVINPGLPQNISDPDISGKAVMALEKRMDKQSMIFQQHYKYAKRYDALVWLGMAKEIYDIPRKLKGTLPDGTVKDVEVMKQVFDRQSGRFITINDITHVDFKVKADIGIAYGTAKEQTIDRITNLMQFIDPNDPVRKALMLKMLELMGGTNFDDIREYSRKQLVLMGFKKPETDEEKQMLAQAQQGGNQPDPATLLAMAENKKGDAALMREERENAMVKIDYEDKAKKREIDKFNALTKRMDSQIKAQQADANIKIKGIDTAMKHSLAQRMRQPYQAQYN